MDGRKPPLPSSGFAIQVDTERRVVEASQVVEGHVKELFGPRLDELILAPKEGSNGHEGSEVRYEVLGQNWHFRHFDPRFRLKRAEEEALDVVQGGHSKFIHAFNEEKGLQAVIFRFDAVLRLVFLAM